MNLVETLDIGAVDNARRKALFLTMAGGVTVYTITVGRGGEVAATKKVRGVYGFTPVPDGSATFRRLISHVLRRAICRGIDKAEIHETDVAVLIDLGELDRE